MKKLMVGTVEVIELPCCACEGRVSFGTPETTDRPTFFHTTPYCERFNATDTPMQMVDYMQECVAHDERKKALN